MKLLAGGKAATSKAVASIARRYDVCGGLRCRKLF